MLYSWTLFLDNVYTKISNCIWFKLSLYDNVLQICNKFSFLEENYENSIFEIEWVQGKLFSLLSRWKLCNE